MLLVWSTTASPRTRLSFYASLATLLSSLVQPGTANGQSPTLDSVVAEIRNGHKSLLRSPSGFTVEYTMTAKNFTPSPRWLFGDAKGEVMMKWPKIYCKFTATNLESLRDMEYQGEYDFETLVSTRASQAKNVKSTLNVYRSPHQNAFLQGFCLPLKYQYYDEIELRYQNRLPTENSSHVPSVLINNRDEYEVQGPLQLGEFTTVKLERPGVDEIWFSVDHGYAIVQRKQYLESSSGLREVMEADEFRPVGSGWLPSRFSVEIYHSDGGTELYGQLGTRLDYTLTKVDESAAAEELSIAIPRGSFVTDMTQNRVYLLPEEDADASSEAAREHARHILGVERRQEATTSYMMVNLAVVLGVAVLILWRLHAKVSR